MKNSRLYPCLTAMLVARLVRMPARWLAIGLPSVLCLNTMLASEQLKQEFVHPPDSARPQTWWHWMDGNITKDGIKADLEAMARVGIGGAQIFDVAHGTPQGKAPYGSPEWRDLVKFAAQESSRLGLELSIHNCAGWSTSGGPWITPELSMQKLVWSESFLQGPKQVETVLPRPETVSDFYRDIAVLAFPSPDGENVSMAAAAPKLSTSSGEQNEKLAVLMDGNAQTAIAVAGPQLKLPLWVQLEFPETYLARSLSLTFVRSQHCQHHHFSGEVQISDDGLNFRKVCSFTGNPPELIVTMDAVESRWYRIVFTGYTPPPWDKTATLPLAELTLLPAYRKAGVQTKALFTRAEIPFDNSFPALPDNVITHRGEMVDLTSKLDHEGKLRWNAPPGKWTLLRLGHTTTGAHNHPAPLTGKGLECDKLSKDATEAHFNGLLSTVIDDVGQLAGRTLNNVLIDSWEAGSQNWTPKFREEFLKRRGYDPVPLLPVVTGRVVDSAEVSERFLWDFRQTMTELVADNYAGHLGKLAQRHGMRLTIEAYGDGPFNDLTYAGRADEPMTEFWSYSFGGGSKGFGNGSWNPMATAAHVYGRKIIGAEAFSATWDEKWLGHPGYIKDLGDSYFCEGINRFVFHSYAMQPWTNPDRFPGMSMGPCGLHYVRTQTWWEQSKAWHQYLARCQYLLQSGLFVADIVGIQAEGAFGVSPLPNIKDGYRFDICPAEVVLTRMAVKDGRILLPDGMSYRVLVLPDAKTMTPPLLRKLKELVAAGATVIGPRPERSASLVDYPQCDNEMKLLAAELWGDCDGKTIQEHAFGQGRVIWGRTPVEFLETAGVKPDFSTPAQGVKFIHRTIGDAEVYFVASRGEKAVETTCSFRVTGKQPELWYPDTGRIEDAAVFEENDGQTTLPLRLDAAGSVFVVFRKAPAAKPHPTTGRNWQDFKLAQEITGPWEIGFDPKWGGPAQVTFDKLEDWSKRAEDGIRFYSGTAVYRKAFTLADSALRTPHSTLHLDLGKVAVMAEVKLNGKDLGILWKPPFRVEITEAVKPGANTLEVKVVNLWVNRMIGDEQLAGDCDRNGDGTLKSWPSWVNEGKPSPAGRYTFASHPLWRKTDALVESGLLGPVTIQTAEW